MSEDLEKEIAELKRKVAELEAKAKPKPEFKPTRPYQPIDWTAGMRLSPSAAQAMAKVVPDVKPKPMTAEEVASSWARSRVSEPSGFGPGKERMAEMEREARRKDKEKEAQRKAAEPQTVKDHRSSQTRIVDDMVEYWVGGPNDTSKLR